jgi:hypothetical protein
MRLNLACYANRVVSFVSLSVVLGVNSLSRITQKDLIMDILLISAGVKAILRAAQTGIDLRTERNVNESIFLPHVRLPNITPAGEITQFLNAHANYRNLPPFAQGWHATDLQWHYTSEANLQGCLAAQLSAHANDNLIGASDDNKRMQVGGHLIEQWRKGNSPPTAWARIALSIVDIGLEFVSANPAIMGERSKGESLVLAFAESITVLIPDDVDDMGKGSDFENRLLSIFLRSGLTVLANDSNKVIEDQQINALVKGIIGPLISAIPSDFHQSIKYRELIETLMGPSSVAVLNIAAADVDDYIGQHITNDKALSAVTLALLNATIQVTDSSDISTVFSTQGLASLFTSTLQIAIDQPELFISDDNAVKSALVRDLFAAAAKAVEQGTTQGIDPSLGSSISTQVINIVGKHASVLMQINPHKPWQVHAQNLMTDVIGQLGSVVSANRRLALFSRQQLSQYAQSIVVPIGESVSMLGSDKRYAQRIIAGMAMIIEQDNQFLMSNEQWLQLLESVTAAALFNPLRLFMRLEPNRDEGLFFSALEDALDVLNRASDNATILFKGELLLQLLQNIVISLAGNISGLVSQPQVIRRFMDDLINEVTRHPDRWGSESILTYVEGTLETVLITGHLPQNR